MGWLEAMGWTCQPLCRWVPTSFSTLRLQMKRIDGDEKLMTELKAAEKHRFGVEFSAIKAARFWLVEQRQLIWFVDVKLNPPYFVHLLRSLSTLLGSFLESIITTSGTGILWIIFVHSVAQSGHFAHAELPGVCCRTQSVIAMCV